jgi:hypothetical protein
MEIESVKPVITDVPDEILITDVPDEIFVFCVLPYLDQKTKSALSLVSKKFYDIVLISYTNKPIEIWVYGRKFFSFCCLLYGLRKKIKKLSNSSLLLSIHAKKEFPSFILSYLGSLFFNLNNNSFREFHFSNGSVTGKHLELIKKFKNLEKISFENSVFVGGDRILAKALVSLPENLDELNLSGSPSICYILSSTKDKRFLPAINEIQPKKLVLSEDFVRAKSRYRVNETLNGLMYSLRKAFREKNWEVAGIIAGNIKRRRNILHHAINEENVQKLRNSGMIVIVQPTSQ